MNNFIQLNINPTPSDGLNSSSLKTPGNLENGLFQAILGNMYKLTGNNSFNPYADLSEQGFSGKGEINSKTGKLPAKSDKASNDLLPESLQNKLIIFLKNQGFSLKEINQLIASSKNKYGQIKLSTLFASMSAYAGSGKNSILTGKSALFSNPAFYRKFISFLKGGGSEDINGTLSPTNEKGGNQQAGLLTLLDNTSNNILGVSNKTNALIEPDQVPKVEEVLFKLGLGSGDVKSIIENSLNGKGELDVDKLTTELNKHLSSQFSESSLTSLLSGNNITVTPMLFDSSSSGANTKSKLINSDNIFSEDFQDKIKQNIASLLKDKGIPEQKIKSVLESFNIDLRKLQLQYGKDQLKSGSWNERMLTILKNEKLMISDDLNKTLGQKNGGLKLNIAGLIKEAEKNTMSEQLLRVAGGKTHAGDSDKSSIKKTDSPTQTKELPDTTNINITAEKEIGQTASVNSTNSSVSLPQPLPKILDRMLLMIRSGEQKSRIQIMPPELGRLDIDLTIKDGHIHANLNTENALVKQMIETNLSQLKQQLNNHGLTVDRFDVTVGFDKGNQRDSGMWSNSRKRRGSNSRSALNQQVISPVKETVVSSNILNSQQVDVHV